MANKEKDELKDVLDRLEKADKNAKTGKNTSKSGEKKAPSQGKKTVSGKGSKQYVASKNGKKPEPDAIDWKDEFTLGAPAVMVDTILLYLGVWIFSVLYKAFVNYTIESGTDAMASVTYYVSPVTGLLGVVLFFILKNVYDLRFYKIQSRAKKWRQKNKRILEWVMYVLSAVLLEMLIFWCFFCGNNFFDTYTFENEVLANVTHTILLIVVPLLYPMHAIVRVIMNKYVKEDTKKAGKGNTTKKKK